MSQPISITTLDGVRLDVSLTAKIELNMGGISLLDLAERTATYTNSFSLPRTPTNEAVFNSASQMTRNNRPSINVIISKGLFQKIAILTIVTFATEYACSVAYSDVSGRLTDLKYEMLYSGKSLAVESTPQSTVVYDLCTPGYGYDGLFYLRTNGNKIPTIQDSTSQTKSLFVKTDNLLSKIATNLGITIDGTLLSNSDFQNSYVNVPDLWVTTMLRPGIGGVLTSVYTTNIIDSSLTLLNSADLIKRIALLFFADVVISDNKISLNIIDLNATPINLEGFVVTKYFSSGLSLNNYVRYDTSDTITDKTNLSDDITSEGVGDKELLSNGFYVPQGDGTLFDVNAETKLTEKCIFAVGVPEISKVMNFFGVNQTSNVNRMAILTITGFYSSKLNPIFANPVILDATKWIDPLTADSIMNTRIINSVQLGGRYWVDAMAYDLNSGQSKMKLIKLP